MTWLRRLFSRPTPLLPEEMVEACCTILTKNGVVILRFTFGGNTDMAMDYVLPRDGAMRLLDGLLEVLQPQGEGH